MIFNSTVKKLATALLLTATTTSAFAGAVKTVKLSKNGIDVVPIEVVAKNGKYTSFKTKNHTFGLSLYAYAAWGKKIKTAQIASGAASMPEHTTDWNKYYSNNSRTFKKNIKPNIAVKKLKWSGINPITLCNLKLAQNKSMLIHGGDTNATVYFQLAASNKKQSKLLGNAKSIKKKSLDYAVRIKCLPQSMSKGFKAS